MRYTGVKSDVVII